jgi:hypothetical protein
MSNDPILAALPDDIEQFLLDDQPLRAAIALAQRRGITISQSSFLVDRWLFERQRAGKGGN